MRARTLACLVVFAGLIATGTTARAQPSDGERAIEIATARDAFRSGLAHAQAGRWPEARSAFSRSYAIAPRSITRLNLAGAQAQTGALVLAAETYRRFIREPGRRGARHREAARNALSALELRIAHVTFAVSGLRPGDVVRLDSEGVAAAILDGEVALDPGQHQLEVSRDGGSLVQTEVVAERSFRVEEGEHINISLAVPTQLTSALLPQTTGMVLTDPDEAPPQGELTEDPLFWVVLIGALVLGGVGVGIGVNLSQGPLPSDVVGERTRL